MSSDTEVLERQIPSLVLLEQELHELYKNLSKKVEDLAIKTLLTYIAVDSLKHSNILTRIVEEFGGSKVKEKDFDMNIRYNKNLIVNLSRDVSKVKKIVYEDLTLLIDTLMGFESLLFNEYSKAFRVKRPRFQTYWRSSNNQPKMDILSLIVGDEERHQEILLWIISPCDKKLNFKNDALLVKYQNPDAWYVPHI